VTGKRSLAALLQERHRPTVLSQDELHQRSVARRTPRAIAFAGFLVGLSRQRDLARAIDLAGLDYGHKVSLKYPLDKKAPLMPSPSLPVND
jgi:hypothetical protein